MPNEFYYEVSLSHSAKDKAVVRSLAERLRTCRAEAAGRRRKDGLEHGRPEILHSSFYLLRFPKGSLAQFLPSHCLTSPVSRVRIQP